MEQLKNLRSDVKLARIGDKIFISWPLHMNRLQWFLLFRDRYERPIIVPTSVWEALEGSTGENIRSFFVCSVVNYVAEFFGSMKFSLANVATTAIKIAFLCG